MFFFWKMEKGMQVAGQFVLSHKIPAYWYWCREATPASLYVWTFWLALGEIIPKVHFFKTQESLFLFLLEAQVAHDSS